MWFLHLPLLPILWHVTTSPLPRKSTQTPQLHRLVSSLILTTSWVQTKCQVTMTFILSLRTTIRRKLNSLFIILTKTDVERWAVFCVTYTCVHYNLSYCTVALAHTSYLQVVLTPNSDWGGEGSLGCGIGYGYLHRIPAQKSIPPQQDLEMGGPAVSSASSPPSTQPAEGYSDVSADMVWSVCGLYPWSACKAPCKPRRKLDYLLRCHYALLFSAGLL